MRERKSLDIMLIIIFLAALILCAPAIGKIIYVDASAAGANNGSSWADAYNYLQDALADANTAEKPVEIHLAQGLYKPDRGAGFTLGDRGASFHLINGVRIEGGYAGVGEDEPDLRNVELYQSVLSGDLNGDDDPEDLYPSYSDPTKRDNSCSVVSGSFTDQTAVLDGVTITGAHQDGRACRNIAEGGAAMTIESGSPTIIGCTFTGKTGFFPESVLATRSGSAPTLIDCTFSRNQAGDVLENEDSNLALIRCTFSHNSGTAIDSSGDSYLVLSDCAFAYNQGGVSLGLGGNASLTNCMFEHHFSGISNLGNAELTDCTFEYNRARSIGHSSGNLLLTGCRFRHNSGPINFSSGQLTASKCSFIGNGNADRAFGGAITIWAWGSSILEDCEFSGNVAERGGAIDIKGGPATISNCVFAGNLATQSEGGAIYSQRKYVTVRNCTFSGNFAAESGGALYTRSGGRVENCIFWDNGPSAIGFRGEPVISYSNIQGGWVGEGNIDLDPGFVAQGTWDVNGTPEDPNDDLWVEGDYHLLSEAGRWDGDTESWVRDAVTSPCIDAGDPNSPIGTESFPNGGRPNMGAYGASEEASRTFFGEPACETILAGDINGDCVVDFDDLAIVMSQWMMSGEDFINKAPTVRILEPQDGDRIAWPGPTIFRAEANDVDGQVDKVTFNLHYESGNYSTTRVLGATEGIDGWQRDYTWRGDITDGVWTIWVEATDNEGVKTTSPPITVTLYRP